ncbi:MAG TPA: alginate export family protein [Leptospiraceae bacterium]|nr:alginate export family protein [Leptospiraceae bacterium]
MKIFITVISIFFTLSGTLYSQGDSSEENEKNARAVKEIEESLKKNQEELEALKKRLRQTDSSSSVKSGTEDSYVSPLKTGGLTPDYNRSMFIDADQSKFFNKNQKPWLNDWIRAGAYIRTRYEDRFNLGFDKQAKGYISRALQTTQLFMIIDPSPYFSMKINLQDARVFGGSTPASVGDVRANTFAGSGNTLTAGNSYTVPSQTTVREAWFMMKNLPLDVKIQIGRQIPAYGDQRMLGGANWTINGLSYDGARLMIDKEYFNFHILGYKLTGNQSGTNNVLSANAPIFSSTVDPATGKQLALNQGQPNQYIFGTYNTVKMKNWFHLDLYSLGLLTARTPYYPTTATSLASVNANLGNYLYQSPWTKQQNNLITTGFRLTNRTAANALAQDSPWKGWDWTFESAWQTGLTGTRVVSNSAVNAAANQFLSANGLPAGTFTNQNQKYAGAMYVAQTGYTFFERTRIGLQYIYATGDNRSGDGTNGTFQTLPGPRMGTAPWNNMAGTSENIDMKNLKSTQISISHKTEKWGTFHASYFWNIKTQTNDAWYAVNGAANAGATTDYSSKAVTGNRGRNIYNELDLTWMYGFHDYVSLWIGGGVLTAGNAVKGQKNAVVTYDPTVSGNINGYNINTSVARGASGAASQGYFMFFQFNALF